VLLKPDKHFAYLLGTAQLLDRIGDGAVVIGPREVVQ
jgi:hypothetical protein